MSGEKESFMGADGKKGEDHSSRKREKMYKRISTLLEEHPGVSALAFVFSGRGFLFLG
jgi:hypothetical protein